MALRSWGLCLAKITFLVIVLFTSPTQTPDLMLDELPEASSFLVQGDDLDATAAAVRQVGGEVTHELAVIHAVAARLAPEQVAQLKQRPTVKKIYENRSLEIATNDDDDGDDDDSDDDDDAGPTEKYTRFPKLVKAPRLHNKEYLGDGVSLAVIDTGLYPHPYLLWNSDSQNRILAHYDAIEDRELSPFELSDFSGHGSHVASISVNSSDNNQREKYSGMAPDADLVVVKAFDENGRGTYADVIRGLDWVIANKDWSNIRVLNLSFSAAPRSFYWDDPLNQAVMAAWQAGIVVVVAAGNGGPQPMTVGVPGNVPYVITVGTMSDAYSPGNGTDDFLASFSATGPTVEGFIKPELVAPGGHIKAVMSPHSNIAREFPEFYDGNTYFMMSGTSQAAAVVSGAVLLMLDKKPGLTPDKVKCRLLASAQAAVNPDGQLAYSPLQQGAGLLNALAASKSKEKRCANGGLDIDLDLAGIEHYAGPVRLSDDGSTFYIEGAGYDWSGVYPSQGYLWTGGNPWIDASVWSSGNPWIDASTWSSGNPWIDASGNPWIDASGNPWIDASWWNVPSRWSDPLAERMSINQWVDQE